LPTIASSHNSTSRLELEMKAEQASAIPTKFEQVLEKLNNTYFPAIDPDISVKARISILEGTAHSQKEYNKQNVESFATLSNDINLMDQNLKKIIIDMQMDFEKRLTLFKKEYDHRFEIQASENKRLQSAIATLKSDSNQTKRKLQSTIEKLRKLQREFGDPDDLEEESSVLFSTTNSLVLSRPNTTGFM